MTKSFVLWDGSPLTVKDILRMIPGVVEEYFPETGILYVKTKNNPRTPVPYGWLVYPAGENLVEIRESNA